MPRTLPFLDRTLDRHARSLVEESLADTPIVVIQGARQVGKSTLAARVLRERPSLLLNLDDPGTRAAAVADPVSFVDQLPDGCVGIDEVQRVPELILALKASVDRDRRPGRFLLAGSADLLRLPTAQDSLAGRSESIELFGFSQGELDGRKEDFVDRILSGDRMLDRSSSVTRSEYLSRVCAGGFPEVLKRATTRRRQAWLDNYAQRIVARDAADVSGLERLAELPVLLRLLAARNAGELNRSSLARAAGIPERTLPPYLALLETLYLVQRIPAWSGNLSKRIAGRPKMALLDSGLAARLVNVAPEALTATVNPTPAGPLVEGFVLGELRKQLTWSEERPALLHFRNYDGPEVDVVLEAPDGRIAGIEVKASATIDHRDFRWLEHLRDRLGHRFVAGVTLYTGQRALPFGDRLSSLPVSALWA